MENLLVKKLLNAHKEEETKCSHVTVTATLLYNSNGVNALAMPQIAILDLLLMSQILTPLYIISLEVFAIYTLLRQYFIGMAKIPTGTGTLGNFPYSRRVRE